MIKNAPCMKLQLSCHDMMVSELQINTFYLMELCKMSSINCFIAKNTINRVVSLWCERFLHKAETSYYGSQNEPKGVTCEFSMNFIVRSNCQWQLEI